MSLSFLSCARGQRGEPGGSEFLGSKKREKIDPEAFIMYTFRVR